MFRRLVAITVVLGLFASNLAAVPHAHGSMTAAEQADHDSTPHFHLPFGGSEVVGHSHGAGHAHHHHRHHHKYSHRDLTHAAGAKVKSPIAFGQVMVEHDASAVYGPSCHVAIERVDVLASAASLALVSVPLAMWVSADGLQSSCWHRVPIVAPQGGAAPLFLALRTLRI